MVWRKVRAVMTPNTGNRHQPTSGFICVGKRPDLSVQLFLFTGDLLVDGQQRLDYRPQ